METIEKDIKADSVSVIVKVLIDTAFAKKGELIRMRPRGRGYWWKLTNANGETREDTPRHMDKRFYKVELQWNY